MKLDLKIIKQRFGDKKNTYGYKKKEQKYLDALYQHITNEEAIDSDNLDDDAIIAIYKIITPRLNLPAQRDDKKIRNEYNKIYDIVNNIIKKKIISPDRMSAAYVQSFIQSIEHQIDKRVWFGRLPIRISQDDNVLLVPDGLLNLDDYKPKAINILHKIRETLVKKKVASLQSTVEHQYLKELATLIPHGYDYYKPLGIKILLEIRETLNHRIITASHYDPAVEERVRAKYRVFLREVDLRVHTILVKLNQNKEKVNLVNKVTPAYILHFIERFDRRFAPKPSRYSIEKQYIDQLLTLLPKKLQDSSVIGKNIYPKIQSILKSRSAAMRRVHIPSNNAMVLYFEALTSTIEKNINLSVPALKVVTLRNDLLNFEQFAVPSRTVETYLRYKTEKTYLRNILKVLRADDSFPNETLVEYTSRVLDTDEFDNEETDLRDVLRALSKDLTDNKKINEEMSEIKYEALIVIFHSRDVTLRSTHNHYTKNNLDPMNLNYLEFGARIDKGLIALFDKKGTFPPSLSQILMHFTNTECVNLSYALKFLNFKHPNPQGIFALNRYSIVRENNTIRYAPPEFYGFYFCNDRIYSFIGLYAINHAKFKEIPDPKDINRPIYLLDLSHPEVFQSLYTLNEEKQKRALHVKEIEQLMCKPHTFDDSKSLPLRFGDEAYLTPWGPIQDKGARVWRNHGTLEYDLVLNLIECYFACDPAYSYALTEPWTEAFARWCDALLHRYDTHGKVSGFRPVSDVNCLYGQVVQKKYFYDHLVSLLRDSSEENLHQHMSAIAEWYCRGEGDSARIDKLFVKSKTHYKNAVAKGNSYFLLEETRHEKLLRNLSDKRLIHKNYRRFMIASLTQDEDPISLDSITKIPFRHSVLSADGTKMYDLRICKEYGDKHRVFLNLNLRNKPFFEPSEIENIRKNSFYVNCLTYFEDEETAREICRVSNPALKTNTIKILRDFLDLIYHYGDEDSEFSVERADICVSDAFQNFYMNRYLKLDPDEKERFDNYQVFGRQKRVSIGYLIANIWDVKLQRSKREDTACINEIVEPLFQVIADYDVSYRFREFIERWPDSAFSPNGPKMLQVMRSKSQHLVCSDNNCDATRKLKILLSKMMLCISTDWMNGMTAPKQFCQDVINHIHPVLQGQTLNHSSIDNAYPLYTDIIERMIKPEIDRVNNLVRTHRSRQYSFSSEYKEYARLLEDIAQLSFSEDEMQWYELNFLIKRLELHKDCPLVDDPKVLFKHNELCKALINFYKQQVAFLFNPMTPKTEKDLSLEIQFFHNKGIDIRTVPKGMQTHMLDVQVNITWQRFLLSIPEHADVYKRYFSKATPSNSFDGMERAATITYSKR